MIKTQKDLSFTQSLKRLEEIVSLLENPDLDLEKGLSLLEEGVRLHQYCKGKLTEANNKIAKILTSKNSDYQEQNSEI